LVTFCLIGGTDISLSGEQINKSGNTSKMQRLSKNRLAMLASLDLHNFTPERIADIWIKYETGLHNSIKNNGKQYTLGLYKDCYTFLRNYLLELPTQPLSFCKVDLNGIPKPLWTLRPLIKGDRDLIRIALTIARSYEQIRLEVDYSKLDSITDEMSEEVQKSVRVLSKKFKRFLKKFTLKRKWYLGSLTDPIQPWQKVLTSLTKGPNGPAVACSHLDATAVVQDKVLASSIEELNRALGQEWITTWMKQQALSSTSKDNLFTGRLGFSAEPAGKTRIFAIGDYWSQLSLKPIQISLYRTLQSINTDATSNQDKGFSSLIEESKGHRTYCFDLSSASDRIPAIMQKHRLELMSNRHVADSWFNVMTKRDFYIKATGQSIRWKVGQPLGLLSSFPSFALWHHDIVQFAANWENYHKGSTLRFFKQYRILGDDIVIFDTKVARRYQWLLKKIGLEINLSKSVIGNEGNSQIEFAKRLSLRGKEMSSLKHNILSKNDIHSILDLVELLGKRDFTFPDTGHHGLCRILKSEDLQRLQYMLWLRLSSEPSLIVKRGNSDLIINRDDIIQRIISKRTANIIKKAMEIKPLDMETEFPRLVNGFTSIDVSCDAKTLADRSIGDLSGSHPIVLALTQTSRELQFLMFTVLDDLEPDTVTPVEYLPVVSSKSYYSDLKARTRFLSKIILECFQEALDDQNESKA
jgi:hypothetical protein